ncbi:F-box domain containing protein [Pandoravirus japonicus]|uniref:F-box domain containing protein n=1 Tax=Pandoravirus japonicus TaxID=2823154 RepID=A0A811BMC9_9VIRU|nr:F-box domain containing protein [Pandoravirus japonicus]
MDPRTTALAIDNLSGYAAGADPEPRSKTPTKRPRREGREQPRTDRQHAGAAKRHCPCREDGTRNIAARVDSVEATHADDTDGTPLPEEILVLIAGYCDLPDLCRLARASRTWHRVVSDARLWKAAYARRLPACASPHRCRGVLTNVVADAAFFAGGLSALGVPGDDPSHETTKKPDSDAVLMDTEDETSDDIESPIIREETQRDTDSSITPVAPPACIPHWAVAIGEALSRCCARVARSSGEAYAHASVAARNAAAAAPPCRHVPPSLGDAFGLGAPFRATSAAGPQFVHGPSGRPGIAHRSARVFGHTRGVFEWPARLATPGTHRAVLFTDGRSYTNTTDEVSMVLLLVDADGRAVWALACASPSESLAIDGADWCVVGPFASSAFALPGASETETALEPLDATEAPAAAQRTALFVGRRPDGALVCAPTERVPTFLSTVRGLLRDIGGPCIMRSSGSDAIYRGRIRQAMREGEGAARTAVGDLVYVGGWHDDLPAGHGTLYAAGNVVVFRGPFVDGVPEGDDGTLCVPPRETGGRACKVWARRWRRVERGLAQWTEPCGSGHIRLDDGTRLDCLWDAYTGRPPVVVRIHVPPGSSLARDGEPCVLDLTARPPTLYDDALVLMDDGKDNDGDGLAPAPDAARRRRGARGVEVPPDVRRRRSAKSRWTARIPAPFIAAPLSMWPPELVAKPGDWMARTLAQPALRFAVDLAPHRPGRLVVDLLDH